MVADIRRLGRDKLEDDHPTDDWLADWEALVEARERYAQDLSAGRRARLVVPTVDGRPITHMNTVGLDCEVPPQLLDLQR